MTAEMKRWYFGAGSLSRDGMTTSIGPSDAQGLKYCGLDILDLRDGESRDLVLEGRELIAVPLWGSCEVEVGEARFLLSGRSTPWARTDVLYLPVGSAARVSARGPSRIALPWALAEVHYPVQYLASSEISVELRGAGICSREVHNFGTPAALEADRLIACEVLQPGGNWSSYPPHKHDTDDESETVLEEIYYFEVAASPDGRDGFGLQRAYSSVAGEIDLTQEVRSGDAVVIPYGYHGPTVAAPGHNLYYLNVMAGPATDRHPKREWLISDDPAHSWIRSRWPQETVDSRLPFEGKQ
ncbi:MAG: 5-deoxy-glucuronate isomerase [Cryobacterium sp.]|nr:5-deoxy-glucuronate isomerase [Cryobacterium sp.]